MDNKELYEKSIILIGPSGAGKSTVAEELKKVTGMPRLCLDVIANKARQTGFMNNFRNADEFNSYMIKHVLEDAEKNGIPGIVDFGAGHSVYKDLSTFNRVKSDLRKFKNIILLLPSVDINESLRIMAERSTGDYTTNKEFITSPCNRELSTMTVYGNGRTPNEIATEICNRIKNRENNHDKIREY